MYEAKVSIPLHVALCQGTDIATQILKAEMWSAEDNKSGATGPHYLVHYKGWKVTFVLLMTSAQAVG